jgi:hypothetical protein
VRTASALEESGTVILEVYAAELQTAASATTALSGQTWALIASLLKSMSSAADPGTPVGDLLDSVVLVPLTRMLWAQLKAAHICGLQVQLLGQLLQASRLAIQATLLDLLETDGEADIRTVLRRLLLAAIGQQFSSAAAAESSPGGATKVEGCTELLHALLAIHTGMLEILAREVLELCDPGLSNLAALHASLQASKTEVSAAAVQAARAATKAPTISSLAEVLLRGLPPSARAKSQSNTCLEASACDSDSGVVVKESGDGTQQWQAAGTALQDVLMLAFWRAMLHGCRSCSALIEWHLSSEVEAMKSNNEVWSLGRLLTSAVSSLSSCTQGAIVCTDVSAQAGEISDRVAAPQVLQHMHTEVLIPVAAFLSKRMLASCCKDSSGGWPEVGMTLTRCLFRAALPSLCNHVAAQLGDGAATPDQSTSEVAAAQWRLHFSQAAIADWQPLQGSAEREDIASVSRGESASSLCAALVTEAVEHYALLLSKHETEALGAIGDGADAPWFAPIAAQIAGILDNLVVLAHATGGWPAVQEVWHTLVQALPELHTLDAVRDSLASADSNSTLSVAQRVAGAIAHIRTLQTQPQDGCKKGFSGEDARVPLSLSPWAAVLVALLLVFEDGKWLSAVPWLPMALALEVALHTCEGDLRMAALAACILHEADVLGSGGLELGAKQATLQGTSSSQVSSWVMTLEVLLVLACADTTVAGEAAFESLSFLLAHLPEDGEDSLPERLLCAWAPAYVSPPKVTAMQGNMVLRVLHEVQRSVLSTAAGCQVGTAAGHAQEEVALEWLQWLSKQEPVLANDNLADEKGPVLTHLGMRIVATLLGPHELLRLPESPESGTRCSSSSALAAALAVLDALGSFEADLSPSGALHHAKHAMKGPKDGAIACPNGDAASGDVGTDLPVLGPSGIPGSSQPKAAFASAVQHQLRGAAVQLQVQNASTLTCDALLCFVLTCVHVAAGEIATGTWHRIVAVLHAYLTRVSTAAEVGAENCRASAVALAESIPGAPEGMDAGFALTFLLRLSRKSGIVSQASRADIIAQLGSPVSADVSCASLLLLVRVQHAAEVGVWTAQQELFDELNATLLRSVFCLGVCLHAAWVAGVVEEAAPQILMPGMPFWRLAALCVVQYSGAVLRAVQEFDVWSDDLGVPLLNAIVSIFTCSSAPLALRAAVLSTALHPSLLSRVGPFEDDDECAPASHCCTLSSPCHGPHRRNDVNDVVALTPIALARMNKLMNLAMLI